MGISVYISIGLLFVASASAITSATYFIFKWYNRKYKNPKISISICNNHRFLIPELVGHLEKENSYTYIESLCCWFEINVINNYEKPVIIEKIHAYENNEEERPFFNVAVKKLIMDFNTTQVSEPVPLPIVINQDSPIKFYIMGKVIIPQAIGIALNRKHGRELNFEIINKTMREIEDKTLSENEAYVKLFGIEVGTMSFQKFTVRLPSYERTLSKNDLYNEDYGVVPDTDVLNFAFDNSKNLEELSSLYKCSYDYYILKFFLSDNRICVVKFPTDGVLTWFGNKRTSTSSIL